MIVPITRKEKLLNAIATNGNVDFSPKTREELFLFKILGANVNTPTPITRKEILYQHIIDGTIPTFEPRTRLEKFIMAAAGAELELPVVITREEYWWAEISDSAYETITGAVVHFIAKRARAIKSLIANISYTQDLNGYDSPWPAGGGKNLLWLNNGIFKTGAFPNTTPRETTGVGTWVGMTSSNYLAANSIVSYTIGDNNLTVKSSANGYGVGFECKVTAGQQYTLSWVGTNAYVGIAFYGAAGEYLSYVTSGASPKTFTVPESTANAIIVLRGDAANVTGEFSNVQLEEGQTATAYAPYSNICPISGWTGANVYHSGADTSDATTYSITFPSEAGTVYGGTLDVTTGKLTVNWAMVDLGAKNWYPSTAAGRTRFRTSITDIERISSPNVRASLLCSNYPTKTANQTYQGTTGVSLQQNSADIYIYDPQMESMTGEEFKSAMSGVQLVYKLATPIVYDLTPTEVTTLLGDNTIWADTGDVSVTY